MMECHHVVEIFITGCNVLSLVEPDLILRTSDAAAASSDAAAASEDAAAASEVLKITSCSTNDNIFKISSTPWQYHLRVYRLYPCCAQVIWRAYDLIQ